MVVKGEGRRVDGWVEDVRKEVAERLRKRLVDERGIGIAEGLGRWVVGVSDMAESRGRREHAWRVV